MGLFSRIGAVLGVGAAHVEIVLPTPRAFRDSEVSGQIVLHGGRVPQKVRRLTVDLYEYWVTGHGKHRQYHQCRHQREVLAEYLMASPGMQRTYEFRLQIPADARCTRRREGWEARAEAHIPWSVDPRASAPLQVLPHAEVLAVQRCARDMIGLVPVDWDGRRREVFYNFRAPHWLQHLLDGVGFRLWVEGDYLEGRIDLNKQEHGLKDMLGALVGADHEELTLHIPRSELVTRRGTPRPEGAYRHLKGIFERMGAVVPPIASGIASGEVDT